LSRESVFGISAGDVAIRDVGAGDGIILLILDGYWYIIDIGWILVYNRYWMDIGAHYG